MKIALFSDIHANLPALEAVLADIDRRNPDAVYCQGDLVGYATYPNQVVDLIRQRKIPTIAGNYDEGIGLASDNCGCAYKTDHEKANGVVSIAYTNQVIGAEQREFLRNLPRHLALDFEFRQADGAGKFRLLLVHGSPRRINEYLFEDREEKSLARIMEETYTDMMTFGHTHKLYHRILAYQKNGQSFYRHAINIGSVGKPKDGDPRACYAMLTITPETSVQIPDSLGVEFIRVTYDIEAAAQPIEESPLANEYAHMLRTAY